jgi:hypothetical protein
MKFVVRFYPLGDQKISFQFGTRHHPMEKSILKSGSYQEIVSFSSVCLINLLKYRDTIKKHLNLPSETTMEYKTHNDALRDNSSFRNTDVFR